MKSQSELVQAAVDSFGDGLLTQDDFELNTAGEFAVILDCHANSSNEVVKVPYPSVVSDLLVRYEARVLEALEEDVDVPPPLVVPRLLDVDSRPRPKWFCMSRLPGVSLTKAEIDALDESELESLGTAVGRFAAWMAQNVSLTLYRDISFKAGFANDASSVLSNRVDWVEKFAGGHATFSWLEENGYPALGNILAKNFDDYKRFRNAGLLTNTIFGHDDLDPTNLRFRRMGSVQPVGVLDFGLAKPSNPERELRYVWALSEPSGNAAKRAYEAEMGVQLDERLLTFWAIAQRVTNAVYSVNQPSPAGGVESLRRIGRQLQRLVPEEDLTELQHDFSNRTGLERFRQLNPPDQTVFHERRDTLVA